MSNEVILNLSFDNQTVTDLTGNWTLDGTPNATYEQINGRDGYSIVTGSLGRCIVLNAVDQNTVYNEYTVDFDMFVKSTYTSDYYFYKIMYMWSLINPGNEYSGKIGNVLEVRLEIGGSEPAGTTDYSPIGRWVHVTFTSGPTEVADQYRITAYVDGVKLIDRTDIDVGKNPFALSQQILLLTRDTDAKLMPNGPGICLNTFKVVTGIHIPDQNPAISLFNLSRVFNNFCTWLKRQLSTVAFTGSYNDLSDKPTISTVNDGTLTIQQNGTNVQTFTANASTNKTANIQCVDLSTAQTIGGQKTFTASPRVTRTSPDIALNISDCDVTELPTEAKFASLYFRDKNNKNLAYIAGQQRIDGTKRMCLRTHRTNNINNYYSVDLDSEGDFYPEQNNSLRLGTPALQWNNAYTRNILIDNDINIASSLINKTSTSGVISIRGGLNTQDGASIGLYGKDYNGAIAGNIYMTAYGNSDYTIFRIYPNGVISVTNNSTATTKNVAMQEDVVNLTTAQTIGGVKTFSSNMIIQGSKKVTCNLDNSFIELDGGTTWGKGGSIVLSGQDRSSYTNSVLIVSKSDTNTDILQYQNGELKPLSNNTNNSSLGTSTNKWSKVYSDDVVHTTGDETIGGIKTFTDLQTISYGTKYKGNKDAYILPEFAAGYSGLSITTLSFSQTLKIGNFVLDNNNKPVLDTSKAYIQVATGENNNVNACLLEPRNSTSSSLGTSANKWKSFNGVNPGALSLPSISSTGTNAWIAIDTTNWVVSLATSNAQKYMPPADGWLNVRVDNAVALGLALTDGGNYMHQMVRSETPSSLALLLPVFKDKEVAILVGGNENFAYTRVTFYPCQGNI